MNDLSAEGQQVTTGGAAGGLSRLTANSDFVRENILRIANTPTPDEDQAGGQDSATPGVKLESLLP